MQRVLNRRQLRGFALVIIGVAGLVSALAEENAVPLLVALFAVVFLATPLTKALSSSPQPFLRHIVVAVLVVIGTVGVFNYVVNPLALYPTHFFEPLVLTTRDFKMNLYADYSPPPQALIMGSSRSFTVDPKQIEQLWHYSTFNASLTGGTMQDSLAFWRYIAQVAKPPDLLIINIAPEILLWSDAYRYSQEPDARLWNYVENPDLLYPLKDGFYRVGRLFSKEQLAASLRVLQTKTINKQQLSGYVFDPNGMGLFYGPGLTPADLDPDTLALGTWGQMFKGYQPASYRLDLLRQILEMAKQEHTLVIGYMPPYHPVLRDVLETRTAFARNMNSITAQLDVFEKDYPFHYLNFIDSDTFSNGEAMFYDLIHPNVQASALMMQQLYDQFRSYSNSS